MPDNPTTLLAIASYEKGHDFLRQARAEGARVFLLTSLSLQNTARWPAEAIDEIFYMPDVDKRWNREDTLKAVSYLARHNQLDLIVPLDDFDLELAAFLREHLRLPGLGESTTRFFRDKLAMRMRTRDAGVRIPEFVHVLNHARVQGFLNRVPAPWVLKPRLLAGSIGVKKVHSAEELWPMIERLGDEQSFYLLERYVPGDVCHVDSILEDGEIVFAAASIYGRPPMEVSQQGDVFTTRIVERGSPLEQALLAANLQALATLGLQRGVSHTEYIVSREGGEIFFLETSARVGGAHIADLVEAATGINLWREWARVELATAARPYRLPEVRHDYAALLVSLARQEYPDTSAYDYPELVWRMDRKNHVGLIVQSPSYARVSELLEELIRRVRQDFWTYLPPKEKPAD
jgi:biotin carboxylase